MPWYAFRSPSSAAIRENGVSSTSEITNTVTAMMYAPGTETVLTSTVTKSCPSMPPDGTFSPKTIRVSPGDRTASPASEEQETSGLFQVRMDRFPAQGEPGGIGEQEQGDEIGTETAELEECVGTIGTQDADGVFGCAPFPETLNEGSALL